MTTHFKRIANPLRTAELSELLEAHHSASTDLLYAWVGDYKDDMTGNLLATIFYRVGEKHVAHSINGYSTEFKNLSSHLTEHLSEVDTKYLPSIALLLLALDKRESVLVQALVIRAENELNNFEKSEWITLVAALAKLGRDEEKLKCLFKTLIENNSFNHNLPWVRAANICKEWKLFDSQIIGIVFSAIAQMDFLRATEVAQTLSLARESGYLTPALWDKLEESLMDERRTISPENALSIYRNLVFCKRNSLELRIKLARQIIAGLPTFSTTELLRMTELIRHLPKEPEIHAQERSTLSKYLNSQLLNKMSMFKEQEMAKIWEYIQNLDLAKSHPLVKAYKERMKDY